MRGVMFRCYMDTLGWENIISTQGNLLQFYSYRLYFYHVGLRRNIALSVACFVVCGALLGAMAVWLPIFM